MIRVESIAPDLDLVIGETYESNAAVFRNGRDVLLVDALGSRADAEALREHLDGCNVRFIIATHYFSDHMAGLALFPEALILAHREWAETFESERFRTDEEAGFLVAPSIVVRDGLHIRWGTHALDVFHNGGHSRSTLNVDVPDANLIFTADNVVGNIVYLGYSSPERLAGALEEICRRGRSRMISSHGGVSDCQRAVRAVRYLRRLGQLATRAWSDDPDAIRRIRLDECLPDNLQGTKFEEVFHERNLSVICERRLFQPGERRAK